MNMSRIPKLRFKEFIGEWEEKKFGDIYSFYSTNSFSRDNLNYEHGNIRNIHYGDIHTKFLTLFKLENERVPFINPDVNLAKVKEENYCLVGDLVIADASEDYNDIGKSIEIISLNNEKALAGLHTFLVRPNKHKMALGFVGSLLKSWNIRKQIMTIAQGTKVLSLSYGRLSEVTLSIPSVPEQQKIASFLSAVDTKIDQLTRKKELYEQYKKGAVQKIFSQELRFKADDGSWFPEWEEKGLNSFMTERNIQAPKSDKYPLMAFVANKGVTHKGDRYNREFLVNDGDNKKYKQTEIGDFIYSSNNLETGSIGLNNYGSASISPVYSIFKIKELFNHRFISYFLIRKKFINEMTRYRQGVVYGQWRIHESDFLKIEVNLPCIEEQTKIANFLSAIDSKIDFVTQQIDEVKNFKKGLLQQMFR